jgi:Uma2 family endonuclease
METAEMTAITRIDQLDPNQQYTYADYLTWQFSERVELLRGYFQQMAAPNRKHQNLSGNLYGSVWNYFKNHPCKAYAAPFDVRLPRTHKVTKQPITTVIQPDICVICDPAKLDDAGCIGAPDWVIEILSKGNTKKERCAVALREKFSIYEEAGVREYWIVQPEYDNILVYVLNDSGHYEAKPTLLSTDEAVTPFIFPDLQLNLNDVFAD